MKGNIIMKKKTLLKLIGVSKKYKKKNKAKTKRMKRLKKINKINGAFNAWLADAIMKSRKA